MKIDLSAGFSTVKERKEGVPKLTGPASQCWVGPVWRPRAGGRQQTNTAQTVPAFMQPRREAGECMQPRILDPTVFYRSTSDNGKWRRDRDGTTGKAEGSRLTVVEGGTHFLMYESWDEILSALTRNG